MAHLSGPHLAQAPASGQFAGTHHLPIGSKRGPICALSAPVIRQGRLSQSC